MRKSKNIITPQEIEKLLAHLKTLKLPYLTEHYETLAKQACIKHWGHIEYLASLIEGEINTRRERAIERRIRFARFPKVKTLDDFKWSWPKKINRLKVQNLFRLKFINDASNVIFLGTTGLGKSHLAIALGYAACLENQPVLFSTAIDVINALDLAQRAGRLKQELAKYTKPKLLILDELGYLPLDKKGADLLFQIISGRYEQGSIIITSNRAYKDWPKTFNNDSTLTSAILDRLLHKSETEVIEGDSFRMKDRVEM